MITGLKIVEGSSVTALNNKVASKLMFMQSQVQLPVWLWNMGGNF